MEEKTCSDCAHYCQHYALNEKKIHRIFCGHCKLWPTKTRKPYKTACEHFEQGVPDVEAFASKEYLSKQLLHYMMDLELLPDIRDLEERV